jgi:hypothetical protein
MTQTLSAKFAFRAANSTTEIEGSHLLEIPFREATAEPLRKVARQPLE